VQFTIIDYYQSCKRPAEDKDEKDFARKPKTSLAKEKSNECPNMIVFFFQYPNLIVLFFHPTDNFYVF